MPVILQGIQKFAEEAADEEAQRDEMNSTQFAAELESSIQLTSTLGRLAGREMMQRVCADYEDEHGEHAMAHALRPSGVDGRRG